MKNKIYFSIILLFATMSLNSSAQTNPSPFDLSTGDYSFTSWDSLAPAGTYPANMVFHFTTSPSLPGYDSSAVGTADWDCAYNLRTRNRVLGLVTDGFAFSATSSGQFSDCASVVGNDSALRFVGAVVLGLNATGRSAIQVTFTGGTVLPGDGSGTPTNPRVFVFRLQYRVGTSGNFNEIPGPVQYISSQTAGDAQIIGPSTLPGDCDNMPDVQIRWIYFQVAAGNGGTRPRMRLDEINVTSSPVSGVIENNLRADHISIYPNPSSSAFTIATDRKGKKNILIFDSIGSKAVEQSFSESKITLTREGLSNGFYFVELRDENGTLISKSKLVLN